MNCINKIAALLLLLLAFTACSETDEISVDAAWSSKNTQYIDSIAAVAKADASNEWKRILATGLNPEQEWGNDCYVYCKVKTSGTGTDCPASNSEVWVNYSGSLINGTIFDATYYGEFDPTKETPVRLALDDCVKGFSVALQEMVAGDLWDVYIPASLGYGSDANGKVKANSTLIFTINLVDILHIGETE